MAIDDITIDAGECEEGKITNNILLENKRWRCLVFVTLKFTATIYRTIFAVVVVFKKPDKYYEKRCRELLLKF